MSAKIQAYLLCISLFLLFVDMCVPMAWNHRKYCSFDTSVQILAYIEANSYYHQHK
jgi:hypothetical protein